MHNTIIIRLDYHYQMTEAQTAHRGQTKPQRETLMETVKPDFLRPIEASIALKISRSKLYEALQRGDIPSIKIAGLTRIPRRWIEGRVAEAMRTGSGEGDEPERAR
jgi:hypothetical protein